MTNSFDPWFGRPVIVQDVIRVLSSKTMIARSKVGTRRQRVVCPHSVNVVPDDTVLLQESAIVMNAQTWGKIDETL